MKTMIDIADGLLIDAKEHAEREGVALSALVEKGLRLVLDGQRRAAPGFKLRDASVNGQGLQAEVQGKSWDEIRAMAYDIHRA